MPISMQIKSSSSLPDTAHYKSPLSECDLVSKGEAFLYLQASSHKDKPTATLWADQARPGQAP